MTTAQLNSILASFAEEHIFGYDFMVAAEQRFGMPFDDMWQSARHFGFVNKRGKFIQDRQL